MEGMSCAWWLKLAVIAAMIRITQWCKRRWCDEASVRFAILFLTTAGDQTLVARTAARPNSKFPFQRQAVEHCAGTTWTVVC